MKHLFFCISFLFIAVCANAQTVRPLSVNASNNVVTGVTNTNAITFSNALAWSGSNALTVTLSNLGFVFKNTNVLTRATPVSQLNSQDSQYVADAVTPSVRALAYIYTPDDGTGGIPPDHDTWYVANPTGFRAALNLPWSGLTNSSAANFQAALFSTNTAPTNTTNAAAWVTLQVGTNSYRVPVYK